jgi:hypothetical protein
LRPQSGVFIRAVKRQFQVDDDTREALKDERIDAHPN